MTNCEICGEPMPEGETMFKFHGYSGPCPKPPLPKDTQPRARPSHRDKHMSPVHHSEEYPTNYLRFEQVGGKLMLHQKWCIFEWGNHEGLGQPMNKREEWRQIPTHTSGQRT